MIGVTTGEGKRLSPQRGEKEEEQMKGLRKLNRVIKEAQERFKGEYSVCAGLLEKGKKTGRFPTEEYERGKILAIDALNELHKISEAIKGLHP